MNETANNGHAKQFEFRHGGSFRNVNPQKAGLELERIRIQTGDNMITAADVLAAASDKHSPLHAAFEWNDTEAARRHRLSQAAQLISSIEVKEVVPERGLDAPPITTKPVKAYEPVNPKGQRRGYTKAEKPPSQKDVYRAFLKEMETALAEKRRRFGHDMKAAMVLDKVGELIEGL